MKLEILLPICTGIVAAIQIFYYLYFFRRLAMYTPPVKTASQEYPVSVIVCAKNEADNLEKNLPCVLLQQYQTTNEVIIVNDNSVDESKFLLEEFQRIFKKINVVALHQEAKLIKGKKFPLSVGIKSAKYETLLLTDADCMPASEHWIKKMQDGYYDGKDIVLGYGTFHKQKTFLNKLIRFETFHTALQYLSYALAGLPYMGVGRNLSYKKQLFFKNKGFSAINQVPSGDDDLFINMVATPHNTAIVIDPEAHTLSTTPSTFKKWQRQKFRHYTTAKYYKPKYKFLLGLYSLSHTLIYPLVIATAIFYNVWIALGIYVIRTMIVGITWYKSMKKLNEADLWPLFLIFDIWLFFYNILFAPALWRKPNTWK